MQRKDVPDDGVQKPMFMAIARNTGLAPNGAIIPGNVLPDILLDYKEFCRSGGPVGIHSESWCSNVDDRLDAEFYARSNAHTKADVAALRQELTEGQAKVAAANMVLGESDELFSALDLETVRLGDILEEVAVREKTVADKMYKLLGVRWWGEGAFVREEKRGREIKASSVYRVSKGCIIYNRLFAFRGSFAITSDDHDGCYVSGEFPTFVAKAGTEKPDELCRYVVHCLNSPKYLRIVDAQSTGSTKTSRNRFNQNLFKELTLQRPRKPEDVAKIVNLLDRADELRTGQQRLLDLAKAVREGVFTMLPGPSEGAVVVAVDELSNGSSAVVKARRKKAKSS
jgi:hypothetical protein